MTELITAQQFLESNWFIIKAIPESYATVRIEYSDWSYLGIYTKWQLARPYADWLATMMRMYTREYNKNIGDTKARVEKLEQEYFDSLDTW